MNQEVSEIISPTSAELTLDQSQASPQTPTVLLRGGELATRLRQEIETAKEALRSRGGKAPTLATLNVGETPAAMAYRSSIERTMKRVGIEFVGRALPETATSTQLIRELHELSRDPAITGVIVLMPMPEHLPIEIVFEHLSPLKDVDGVTPVNAGRLYLGLPALLPSTPQGGIELLDHFGVPIAGRNAVVIGRSNVVGRPMSALFLQRDATVTICHSKTANVASLTKEADIVALAVGKARYLTPEMIKPGSTILDFGINVLEDSIVGDADFNALQGVAGAITPVPGGTGPITSLMLARNTITAGFASLAGSLDHL
jgi:methylenetetrahydrofolate dehydrogenase (NADP+) / methenyltetrahydrofolate cyclohydrolase